MTDSELELTRDIGRRLRAARHERGLSLSELAALTDGLYSKSRISNYEQGLRRPSIEAAQVLAEALVIVSAAQLLGVEGGEGNALSAEEMRLLDAFRRVDADWRRRLLDIAEAVQLEPPPGKGRRRRKTGGS
ncbi:MAG: helix-turn-helix domain-containing protein, partial [Gammaproteobacteria bacterium]|nr:helix-turn-helix domain-containing protein [Gammaproteobacteria bacterium]